VTKMPTTANSLDLSHMRRNDEAPRTISFHVSLDRVATTMQAKFTEFEHSLQAISDMSSSILAAARPHVDRNTMANHLTHPSKSLLKTPIKYSVFVSTCSFVRRTFDTSFRAISSGIPRWDNLRATHLQLTQSVFLIKVLLKNR
jgi:hypothetical protein